MTETMNETKSCAKHCLPSLLLILLASFFSHMGIAQEEKPPFKQFELGFNSTLLTRQILNLSAANIEQSPYDFSLRYNFSPQNNFALRFGTGWRSETSKRIDKNSGSATSQDNEFNNSSLDFRLGFEVRKNMGKHFSAHLGFDFISRISSNSSKNTNPSGFNKVEDKAKSLGLGPTLGIQWTFNKHLALYTEGNVYFQHRKSKSMNEFVSGSFSNKTESSGSVNFTRTTLPTTLYLLIRF